MGRGELVLDPRLAAMGKMVGRCARFADIGTDHGRLGAFLLQSGQCETAELTDISGDSLAKARALIERLGLADRAVFSVGDGAEALTGEPEAVVIAGMGGETIAGIVERGRARLGKARLVLQPNVDAPLVREALVRCGYRIQDETVVRAARRLYVIIAAEPGSALYSEEELCIGPVLMREKPEALGDYARFRIRVARKALRGAEGRNAAVERALRRELEIWEGLEACL